jgi:hypothetical protein
MAVHLKFAPYHLDWSLVGFDDLQSIRTIQERYQAPPRPVPEEFAGPEILWPNLHGVDQI